MLRWYNRKNKMKEAKAMETAKRQMLRDPGIEPADDMIAAALGEANDAYLKFISQLNEMEIRLAWRYYTDGKAWLGKGLYRWTGARGGQRETTIFWLSLWQGFFRVTIYVPETSRAAILSLPLDDEVKRMAAEGERMGNRLKYLPLVFDLRSDELFPSVFALADFKKSLR